MDEDNLQESLEQLDAARRSGQPARVLEALRELILDSEDERANLTYIEEMEKLALSLGDKQNYFSIWRSGGSCGRRLRLFSGRPAATGTARRSPLPCFS